MEQRKITVEAGSLEELQKLLGTFDENLNIVTRETGVTASVKGAGIRISGEDESCLLAARVLEGILKLIRAGESVDKSRIVYCIELAREGNIEGIEQVMSGVVAVTSRGKQIKCKTVGQKKYVEAIKKNTVVFGVGPAGTGQDLPRRVHGGERLQGQAGGKDHPHPPRCGSGGKARLSARRPADQSRPLSAPAVRRFAGDVRAGNVRQTDGKGEHRGGAARVYARQDALQRLHHPRRGAEHHRRTDEDVSHAHGDGSKVVVTGDVTQIDLPEGKRSGLKHAVSILKNIEGIETVTLTAKDVVRHPLVMEIVRAYEREGVRREAREERKKR